LTKEKNVVITNFLTVGFWRVNIPNDPKTIGLVFLMQNVFVVFDFGVKHDPDCSW